jgi:glyoxalase superfamily protein
VSSAGSEPTGGQAAHRAQVTFDCVDPQRLTSFWCLAMNYIEQPPPPGYGTWDAFADEKGIPVSERFKFGAAVDPANHGPRLLFLWVPEGKVAKNRVHLDVSVGSEPHGSDERKAAVREHARRLVAAGATLIGERDDNISWWIVLTDPEGNEFCLQ